MQILFDLHTHTLFSHGTGTVMQNLRAANANNQCVAIAEHGAGHRFYGVSPSSMQQIKNEVQDANAIFDKKVGAVGLEANLIGAGGQTDIDLSCDGFCPDFVLLGFHKGASMGFSVPMLIKGKLSAQDTAEKLTDSLIASLWETRIIAITHPGLYIPIDIERLAQACSLLGVALEINGSRPMSAQDATIALDNGAYFIISSDAHDPKDICNHEKAIAVAKQANIPPERIVNSKNYIQTGVQRAELAYSLFDL